MLRDAQLAIVEKDLRVMLARRSTWTPILALPLLLCGLLPLGMVLLASLGGEMEKEAARMLQQMNVPNTYPSLRAAGLGLLVDHMFPMLFLMIPTTVCAVLGAGGFVGEREHKTMETLLYGPISMPELYVAKLLGAWIPAMVVMLGTAVLFGLIIDVGGYLAVDAILFPTARWLVLIFWVAPAVAVVSLSVIVWVSGRAVTSQEAQQQTVMVVLPIMLLMVGQVTGLLMLSLWVLVAGGAVLHGVGFTMLWRLGRGFTREKLL
jgi:ABC-type Na+ efflux pump permease subunit